MVSGVEDGGVGVFGQVGGEVVDIVLTLSEVF